jgi:hypothetical protein
MLTQRACISNRERTQLFDTEVVAAGESASTKTRAIAAAATTVSYDRDQLQLIETLLTCIYTALAVQWRSASSQECIPNEPSLRISVSLTMG